MFGKKTIYVALLASLQVFGADVSQAQAARDYVYVVGSSTVYPFSTVVAERFGRRSRFRTPKVEATGSGGGIKLFCDGIGIGHPDVVNSSRRITPSELDSCTANGVDEVVEVRVGYDGIALANAVDSPSLTLSRRQLFLALAQRVPTGDGNQVVANPNSRWSDIDETLPDLPIEVLGPPPTSGTRDAFARLVLEEGCRSWPWIVSLEASDPGRYFSLCHSIREDGAYVEAGENDNLIVQKLQSNPAAFGILGFSFLDQNAESIKGARIDGEIPTFESISDLSYPVSRPLYFYVKKSHVPAIPGLREYLAEFTSERAWGDDGYLSYRGLVPLPPEERSLMAARVVELTPLAFVSQ